MTKQHIEILRCIIDNHSHDITVSDAREANAGADTWRAASTGKFIFVSKGESCIQL